jgi:amino acid transporter
VADVVRSPHFKHRWRRLSVVIAAAVVALLAYTGFGGTYSGPEFRNGPASSIGKSGEMKSPGGTTRVE